MSKSQSSKTITPALPVPRDERSIGTQHGATGSDATANSTPTPMETDQALQASLPPSVQQSLAELVDRDFNLTGYVLTNKIPEADQNLAVDLLNLSLSPMPRDTILRELTMLKVKTKMRNVEQNELTLMLTAYADELEAFPEDIVRYILRSYASTSIWFPAWADLAKELQWRTDKRQFKLNALIKGPNQAAGRIASVIENALRKE